MHQAQLTVTWAWIALAIASSGRSAPIDSRNQLDLSRRPLYHADTVHPTITFTDTNGNTFSEERSPVHNEYTPFEGKNVAAAVEKVAQPSLSSPPHFAETQVTAFPQVSWDAPMIRPGAFAPIPQVHETTVTIINIDSDKNKTSVAMPSNVLDTSDGTLPANNATASANATAMSALVDDGLPDTQNSTLQMNVTQPGLVGQNLTDLSTPPVNSAQVPANPPIPLSDPSNDDADDAPAPPAAMGNVNPIVPPPASPPAPASAPAPVNPTNATAAPPAPPLAAPQRRAMLERTKARSPTRQMKSRRAFVVRRDEGDNLHIPGCSSTTQMLVPVTHAELAAIRAGTLSPTFTAHERLSWSDRETGADECQDETSRHHHLILVPVSESELRHLQFGEQSLTALPSGQILLSQHHDVASNDGHGLDSAVNDRHSFATIVHGDDEEGIRPTPTFDIAQPTRMEYDDKRDTAVPSSRLVRRILESHGFDAKLVGNGENLTYHGKEIHDAGDGKLHDSHTLHLDSALDTKEKPPKPAPEKKPPSKPRSVESAAPPPPDAPSDGKKDDKGTKKKGKDGKESKRKAKAAPSPAPAPTTSSSSDDRRDDRNDGASDVYDDRNDVHDDRNDHNDDLRSESTSKSQHGALEYWDGHSQPGSEDAHDAHNAAPSLLLGPSSQLVMSSGIAAFSLSFFIVFLL